jgi:hypothetical protein
MLAEPPCSEWVFRPEMGSSGRVGLRALLQGDVGVGLALQVLDRAGGVAVHFFPTVPPPPRCHHLFAGMGPCSR